MYVFDGNLGIILRKHLQDSQSGPVSQTGPVPQMAKFSSFYGIGPVCGTIWTCLWDSRFSLTNYSLIELGQPRDEMLQKKKRKKRNCTNLANVRV